MEKKTEKKNEEHPVKSWLRKELKESKPIDIAMFLILCLSVVIVMVLTRFLMLKYVYKLGNTLW